MPLVLIIVLFPSLWFVYMNVQTVLLGHKVFITSLCKWSTRIMLWLTVHLSVDVSMLPLSGLVIHNKEVIIIWYKLLQLQWPFLYKYQQYSDMTQDAYAKNTSLIIKNSMWWPLVWLTGTSVSEEHTFCIFRVEDFIWSLPNYMASLYAMVMLIFIALKMSNHVCF